MLGLGHLVGGKGVFGRAKPAKHPHSPYELRNTYMY
jgi:hypothetical protein